MNLDNKSIIRDNINDSDKKLNKLNIFKTSVLGMGEDELDELDDIELSLSEEVIINDDQYQDIKQSKHKIVGKHSLEYDPIFKGKKKKYDEDDVYNEFEEYHPEFLVPKQESFNFDVGTSYYDDNMTSDESFRLRQLREDLYSIIVEKTNINIKSSRRKPSRPDFNKYLSIIFASMDMNKYTHTEIFSELSFYFSDNLINMFKLLNDKWGGKISRELQEKSSVNLDEFDFL